jgi:uncharacterized protein
LNKAWRRTLRRWNLEWHRDLGYFFSSLLVLYCISGIALNHVNDWNPDFIVHREVFQTRKGVSRSEVNERTIKELSSIAGEKSFKVFDFPTPNQVKIYYDDATFHVNLENGEGQYEKLTRRHLFYESNVLHRNSLEGWKWVSDVFALLLIVITLTGLFILKGKYGFWRRGIWDACRIHAAGWSAHRFLCIECWLKPDSADKMGA